MSNDPKVAQPTPAPNAANQADKSGADQAAKTDAKPETTPPVEVKKT